METMDVKCRACKRDLEDVHECDNCGFPFCGLCCKSIRCLNCSSKSFSATKFGALLLSVIPVECPVCKKSVIKSQIEEHLSKYCDFIDLTCRICKMTYKRKEIPIHLINKHPSEMENYIYDCSKFPRSIKKIATPVEENDNEIAIKEINLIFSLSNSKAYCHPSNGFHTFSCPTPISEGSVKVIVKGSSNTGYIVIGFSNRILNEKKGYLGGDFGTGNWGLAGNGSIGEEGKWNKAGSAFTQGDMIEVVYSKGLVYYTINGEKKNNYLYKFKFPHQEVYFTVTVYYEKTILILL